MSFTLKPFQELIKLSKEKIEEAKAPIRAQQMKMKGESEMLEIDSQLMDLSVKIDELCTAYPIDYSALLAALDEKALLERRRDQFETIIKQLFPEEGK